MLTTENLSDFWFCARGLCQVSEQHHLVILGGGFGGLAAARALAGVNVRITLLDRTNYHLFQPLLYQVATGGLSPADITFPIRSAVRSQKNVAGADGRCHGHRCWVPSVTFDWAVDAYDTLVMATGQELFISEMTRGKVVRRD